MKTLLILTIQTILLIAVAPLVTGIITRIKNRVRLRAGAPVTQPYYDLFKLAAKEEVVSEHASWIFRAAPVAACAAAITAVPLVPLIVPGVNLRVMGDAVALFFILGIGRFFMALAGLDTPSAFSGMGSSREMFLSALAEPVALLALAAVAVSAGSADLSSLALGGNRPLSLLLAAAALYLAALVETTRVPVDNRETHLELTMVHEAMLLEYSGPSLAMMHLAAHVKQMVFFSLIAAVVLPVSVQTPALVAAGAYVAKIAGLCVITALVEVSVAKMRLFRVPDFLSMAGVLAALAVIAAVMGV